MRLSPGAPRFMSCKRFGKAGLVSRHLATAVIVACVSGLSLFSQGRPGDAGPHQGPDVPSFLRRGMPGTGHAAIAPLVGTWRVHYEVYGTLGRSGDEPPIVSDDIRTHRQWVGGGRFLEDTTEGTLMG